jgi:hypothetical protein
LDTETEDGNAFPNALYIHAGKQEGIITLKVKTENTERKCTNIPYSTVPAFVDSFVCPQINSSVAVLQLTTTCPCEI